MSDKPDLKILEFPKREADAPNAEPVTLTSRLQKLIELLAKQDETSKMLDAMPEGVLILKGLRGATCSIQLAEGMSVHEVIGLLAQAQFSVQMQICLSR